MKKPTNHLGKGLASFAAAFVCAVMLSESHGEHGIGWFVLCLIIIW